MTDSIEYDPIRIEHQRQGDASKSTKEELTQFFRGTFLYFGVAIVGLIAISYLFYRAITFEPDQEWNFFTLINAIPVFIGMLIVGRILSGLKQKIWSQIVYSLAWLILFIGFLGSYGPGLASGIRYTERCINSGCDSDAGAIPDKSGQQIQLGRGGSALFYASENVRMRLLPAGYCLKFNPDKRMEDYENHEGTRVINGKRYPGFVWYDDQGLLAKGWFSHDGHTTSLDWIREKTLIHVAVFPHYQCAKKI